MQDGMFHKNRRKKLEKLRIDRKERVWYDIYVGRLLGKPLLFCKETSFRREMDMVEYTQKQEVVP